jgi:prepilin-type N-terminal cleavage/methylation domain-containing protein
MRQMKNNILNQGFTLIEVLLVITLMGILLTIGLVNFNSEARFIDARNDIRKTHIRTLESAITQYRLQNGSYPAGLTRDYQEICDPDASSCTGFIDLKTSLVPNFLQAIPRDPNDTDNTGGSGYEIAVDEASNTISIRLKSSLREGGVDIKVNDPLPNLEISNANTPLAATVPKLPIVTDGLVLHLDAGNPASYPGTGNTWFNLGSINTNGLIPVQPSTPTFSSANGGIFNFDGVDDYIEYPASSGLTGTDSWTMEGWFKVNGPSSDIGLNVIIDTNSTITSRNLIGVDSSVNKLVYVSRVGATTIILSSNTNLTQGLWYHGVVVRNGTTDTKLYTNAVISNTYSGNIPTETQPTIRIGRDEDATPTAYSNISISNVRIYNRALNIQEIQQNYNALKGRFGL